MSDFYPEKFKEPPKKSPGEREVEIGGMAVQLCLLVGILKTNSSNDDKRAVQRTGELVKRWWRGLMLRS